MFITRSYEPKKCVSTPGRAVCADAMVGFLQSIQPINPRMELLNELLHFMEEHNMSRANQLTTIDLLSLSNFSRARKLMDATLWESVHKRFLKIAPKTFWKESAFTQLKNHGRYVMTAGFNPGNQFELLLGYWVDTDIVTDSPWVGVTWHINLEGGCPT